MRPSQKLNEPFIVKRKPIIFNENYIPSLCWTCGTQIPEQDMHDFHKFSSIMMDKGHKEIEAQKIVLDMQLSQVYGKKCCRRMFFGDPVEMRADQALYNFNDIGKEIKF